MLLELADVPAWHDLACKCHSGMCLTLHHPHAPNDMMDTTFDIADQTRKQSFRQQSALCVHAPCAECSDCNDQGSCLEVLILRNAADLAPL